MLKVSPPHQNVTGVNIWTNGQKPEEYCPNATHVSSWCVGLLLKFIEFYQKFISPFLGGNCRFYPTCSQYFGQAINRHGGFKGVILGCLRILRCGPWTKGGVDLP